MGQFALQTDTGILHSSEFKSLVSDVRINAVQRQGHEASKCIYKSVVVTLR